MKKCLLALFLPFLFLGYGQEISVVDSAAVKKLDEMGEYMGTLQSCKFTLERSIDEMDLYGLQKHFYTDEISMVGPDKMMVKSRGTHHDKDYYYNGSRFVYYSASENNFCVLPAPDNIIKMIDSLHENFGIRFPAADVFYPSVTDDLLAEFPVILYLGEDMIDGKECSQILASNNKMNVQLWIENKEEPLPIKLVIIHKDGNQDHYEATFTNWQVNTKIADSVFNFLPPEDARLINIMAKK
ncbi:DUF2092 domain-containing protein [Galbibacter mesophilus]|uniref:DUF2092 domain-containing protein n=1 Tax=Galbibacter mesophilus TaxID=379069 RepID=UPI00191C9F68|nr:DUF2092 domain-containing protein [Galbibacter mesophilus]MCM5663725.1 DUF2092 domain-containing protein [Galbibacter mesophilus]